ncbi:WXG100 family type VII secretion target [Streptomyces somaliensis DSM 40738]|uniref:WXG100 family type VII secretion target n=1 Tax=Streptomyces somaliensis (strain ATCC 33201 / DSM 40738 / JCM 12659 / KCTC 9044 / NCTC 11332 / NRRL B-12077 / IP 733) TaxID=1134445 RepID=A0AA44IE24_STRE0|nr:WXG100 family type VII secretion target [Streptomyces somaliensis]MCQ0023279.1 WXG100 family type VII secretion target [Streptomyces somaliensis DSM 40738]NKY14873.1 WXG100 family type VII secretion target [Streptomyces somaliensis DSM 40738]
MRNADGDVSEDGPTRPADGVDRMRRHPELRTGTADGVIDEIAACWKGPTATAYRSLRAGVAGEAVRIRQAMVLPEAARRASRDGFTEQEPDTLARGRRMRDGEDVSAAAHALTVPDRRPRGTPTGRRAAYRTF